MSAVKVCKLENLVRFGNGKSRPLTEGQIPVYGGNGILGYCANSNYEDETIVIGRVGAYCGATYYENRPIWVSDNALAAKPKDRNSAKFLYYFLKHLELNQHAGGSSHPLVTHTLLNSLNVEVIENQEQQQIIASILSSLDDKIDLLHRQNKTLETMAETLFRQWFVEAAGESWEEKGLLDVIDLVGGGTPKTTELQYWDGGVPWLSGGDIADAHKSFIMSSKKTITEVGLEKSSAKLLPKYATVITARGTVGKYGMLAEPMTYSQSNYGIMPKIEGCYFFTYLLINHVVSELNSAAYGSVFDTITTTTFRDIVISIPGNDEIKKFDKSISGYFEKKLINQKQISLLEKLRNGLLPKLMSGEVRVV